MARTVHFAGLAAQAFAAPGGKYEHVSHCAQLHLFWNFSTVFENYGCTLEQKIHHDNNK